MNKPMIGPMLLALAGLLAAIPATAATPAATVETGTMLKADQLRAEPFRDGKAVATLAPGSKVEILQRQGGWLRVKTPKSAGWVHMLSVRRGEAGKNDALGQHH